MEELGNVGEYWLVVEEEKEVQKELEEEIGGILHRRA